MVLGREGPLGLRHDSSAVALGTEIPKSGLAVGAFLTSIASAMEVAKLVGAAEGDRMNSVQSGEAPGPGLAEEGSGASPQTV